MKALLHSNDNTVKMVLGSPRFTLYDWGCLSFRYKLSTRDIKLSVILVPEDGNIQQLDMKMDFKYIFWHSAVIPLPSIGKASVKFIASTSETTELLRTVIIDDVTLDYSQCPALANGKCPFV